MSKQETGLSHRRLIGTGMVAKMVVDIGSQVFNPFLSIISAGLGMSVVELGRMVGLRNAMGVFAPLSGALSDRLGYRLVLRVSLLVAAAGSLLLAVSSAPWMVALSIILAGLGSSAFVPNLQAFVSARLPYSLRARGLGMIEYSWALTGIFGLSLVGLLITVAGWRAPFFLLAAGMTVMSLVFGAMPGDHSPPAAAGGAGLPARRWYVWLSSIFIIKTNRRSTYATIIAATLSFFAAMQVTIAHGAWLVSRYGLDAATLGLVALVIGCFDLASSVAVSLFTDRIGKKRSVLIGIVGSLIAYCIMPFLDVGVVSAVLSIALVRMFFEFNIVSHFPLLSEQAPSQRGQVMTLGAAITMLGSTLAGFTGPWLYVNVGLKALAWSSATAIAVALCIVVTFVKENIELTKG
ncbi:MAG: MFS transporter [Spirochaetia bacterium]|nr:MFS transporter [Spirochaetia bacterium]